MINEEIRDREVRLVDENGGQMGVVANHVAQSLAEERGLDLVKIAPQANPPVCKLMDYGKYKFDLSKREKGQRKNQKTAELKEVRLSATIDQHDLEVKAKNCNKFLTQGDKVKVSIRFRGRQATHGEIGLQVMKDFFGLVKENGVIDRQAKQEGRNMFMVLSPK
jgi:translation initiation factor IF-3